MILDIHTPSASFSIVHSLSQESLSDLYHKLSRKSSTDYYAGQVGPGWLKYEYNDSFWNLDDDSDYAIFAWRAQEEDTRTTELDKVASSSKAVDSSQPPHLKATNTLRLHLHSPRQPLPSPPEYCNPSYYIFRASHLINHAELDSRRGSRKSPAPPSRSSKSKKMKVVGLEDDSSENDGVPRFKKQFNRFHEDNGVRTVIGSIGSVQNVRMLLKPSYRHVYMSRKFAVKHSFVPGDAAPGNYGYGGLITIGKWPVTLVPSLSQPPRLTAPQRPTALDSRSQSLGTPNQSPQQLAASRIPRTSSAFTTTPNTNRSGTRSIRRAKQPTHESTDRQQTAASDRKTVTVDVYLSEEPHFDIVLGRSFFEKRQIKLSSVDPTDVVCLDTGEKIECELVILKDGRGEIVTVT